MEMVFVFTWSGLKPVIHDPGSNVQQIQSATHVNRKASLAILRTTLIFDTDVLSRGSISECSV
jgi:hypothetical protein